MFSAPAILAFDPGGTKCHALLVGRDGQALGWGTSEGTGISGRSGEAIMLAARGALAGRRPASLAVVSAHGCIKQTLKLDLPIQSIPGVLERDAALALAGAECGVVVLAGTGSFVYGKTRDGRELHLDGMGPVLGDTGSAHYIGLLALRAAAKSDWHPRFHTTLLQRLNRHLGLQTLSEMINFSLKPKDRSVIAAFARIVDEEARAGDRVASGILTAAADEIADILRAVVERLEMAGEKYMLIGTGSVLRNSDIYWNRLGERARSFAPLLTPRRPPHPAVVGVALAGMRRLQGQAGAPDGGNFDAAAARLLASYANVIQTSVQGLACAPRDAGPGAQEKPSAAPGIRPSPDAHWEPGA